MKGLLDRWGKWTGDPDKDAAIGQGLLATGMSLMGSRGSFGESLGRAGMAGMGQFRDVMEQTRTNKQRDLQLKMMEQQMAAQEAERQRRAHLASLPQQFRKSDNPAEILAGGQPNKAGTDFAGLADAYAGEGEFGMASNVRNYAAPPKRDLREVGGTLFDVDANKPIYTAPKEKSAPAAVQEYEYARSQGYKGSFDQWEHSRRRAGASNNSTNVTYGAPVAGIGPDGQPVFFQPGNRPGAPPQIVPGIQPPKIGQELREKDIERKTAIQVADDSLRVIDKALNHPGRSTATGLSGTIDPRNYIPGTKAKDFRVVSDQLQGKAFLQAFETLKGGGQITEKEGQKATDAIARLSTAQSDGEYVTALRELREVIANGRRRLAGDASGPSKPANVLRFDAQGNPVK